MNDLLKRIKSMGAEVNDVLKRFFGDENMYVEFLKKLPDDDNIVKLRKATEEKDAIEAEHAVHTLKGVALSLGLLPLVDVCSDMLMDFRSGDKTSAFEQIDDVENELNKWVNEIKK